MALRQSPSILIDGVDYKITALPATKSRRLFRKLASIFGPTLGKLASSEEEGVPIDALIKDALDSFDDDLLDSLCDEFAKQTLVNGLAIISEHKGFDAHFSGHILSMYKWLVECLKFEYSDFLAALPDLMQQAGERKEDAKDQKSQTT